MDIGRFDLNLLRILDALLELRSVSATARRLGLSQPAVSASLRKLRDALGDELFIRTGSGLRATPLAEGLADPVRRTLAIVAGEVLQSERFDPASATRHFTVSTSDIGELVFLPRLLSLLRREAPRATARCVAIPHPHLERALEDGSVDLALGYFPDLSGPNMRSARLFEHPFTCLVRADHPVIGDTLSLDDFLASDHLVVNQDGRSQEIFERMMASRGLQRRVLLHLLSRGVPDETAPAIRMRF